MRKNGNNSIKVILFFITSIILNSCQVYYDFDHCKYSRSRFNNEISRVNNFWIQLKGDTTTNIYYDTSFNLTSESDICNITIDDSTTLKDAIIENKVIIGVIETNIGTINLNENLSIKNIGRAVKKAW